MTIDQKKVEAVAHLARLGLSEEDRAQFQRHLSAILDYIEQLKELDVTSVQPLAHVGDFSNAFREDAPQSPLPPEAALQNAPDRQGDLFRVPKIVG